MKKTLFLFLIFLSGAGFAQESNESKFDIPFYLENKNSGKIGLGLIPITVFPSLHNISIIGSSKFKNHHQKSGFSEQLDYFPIFSATYSRYINKYIAINALAAYEEMSINYTNLADYRLNFYRKDMLFKFMSGANFYYLNKKRFRIYSGFEIGMAVDRIKEKSRYSIDNKGADVGFIFHINAVGFEYGKRDFFGFTELGFGSLGVLKVGLGYRF